MAGRGVDGPRYAGGRCDPGHRVTEATYYRWRQEFGGLKLDQVRRLKELEAENTRLRKAVADLTLEKLILKEAGRGNVWSAPGPQAERCSVR